MRKIETVAGAEQPKQMRLRMSMCQVLKHRSGKLKKKREVTKLGSIGSTKGGIGRGYMKRRVRKRRREEGSSLSVALPEGVKIDGYLRHFFMVEVSA